MKAKASRIEEAEQRLTTLSLELKVRLEGFISFALLFRSGSCSGPVFGTCCFVSLDLFLPVSCSTLGQLLCDFYQYKYL